MAKKEYDNIRVSNKNDTQENWDNSHIIPLDGELLIYNPDEHNEHTRIKFGNGEDLPKDLPFFLGLKDGEKLVYGVGEPYPKGGYIFGDYINNKALSEYSIANGNNTIAGWKGFSINKIVSTNEGIYIYISNTIGIEEGDIISFYSEANSQIYKDYKEIKGIGLNYITVDSFPITELSEEHTTLEYIWISTKPDMDGDIDLGKNQFVIGQYNEPDIFASFIVGNGESNERKNSFVVNKDGSALIEKTVAENNKSVVNMEQLKKSIAELVGAAPEALDTLYEIAEALGENENAYGELLTEIGTKVDKEVGKQLSTNDFTTNHKNKLERLDEVLVGKITPNKGEIFNTHSGETQCQATGIASHAEGISTTASGKSSHSEGSNGNAKGINSHKEGAGGSAQGNNSHVEGGYASTNSSNNRAPLASGNNSHAEGGGTISSNESSHAEGFRSEAKGKAAHAEGFISIATGQASHSEGQNTQAIGDRAHAEGSTTIAWGQDSHAEGQNTIVDGIQSHTEGRSTNQAERVENVNWQEKNRIICEKRDSKDFSYVTNTAAHGEGFDTLSLGNSSHAEGRNTRATHDFTHAEGYGSIVTGPKSHVEGGQSSVFGYACHGEGLLTQVGTQNGIWYQSKIGNLEFERIEQDCYVYIELTEKEDNLDIFSTEKEYDILLENASLGVNLTLLEKTLSSSGFPIIKCLGNKKLEALSRNISNGSISQNEVIYFHSKNCVAAHAEGKDTKAIHDYSHAGGLGTITSAKAQTVIGKYNKENSDALFIVGNGSNDASEKRSNAFTVNSNGTATVKNTGTNSDNVVNYGQLQNYVNTQIGSIEVALDNIIAIQNNLIGGIN